jgi:type I restriction enzyme S subunit
MREGWEIRKLSEIGKVFNGNSINEKVKKDNYTDIENGLPYIATKDISYTSIISYENGVKIPFDEKSSFKIAPKDTVLICAEGGSAGRKIGFTNQDICFGNKLFAFTASKNIESRYVFYYFFSSTFQKLFSVELAGIIGGVSMNKFKDIEIPLPPLPEQQRIVAILDEAFAAIEKAKSNAEKNLMNSKELFESYLKGVFENKEWSVKYLNEISQNYDSKRIPITKNLRKEGSIPYYGASGVVDFVSDYIFDEDLLCVSEDGANLLARTYPIAFSISGKTWVNNHAHVLKFNDISSQKFVEYYLNAIKLDDYISGMAQPKLNQAKLNTIPIPYPSLDVRTIVVDKLTKLATETKQLASIYQQKLTDLEELKKSILQKAFNGELKTADICV